MTLARYIPVIPAKAGIPLRSATSPNSGTPAFAGATKQDITR